MYPKSLSDFIFMLGQKKKGVKSPNEPLPRGGGVLLRIKTRPLDKNAMAATFLLINVL
jgi:hypothetical protein